VPAKQIQRYLYNVPYLFSKVETQEVFQQIITRVTKTVDNLIRHMPFRFKNSTEQKLYENLILLQEGIKDLYNLAQ